MIVLQPVLADQTGQGYQIGSTMVIPGRRVHANSAGELIPGDKNYSPSSNSQPIQTQTTDSVAVAV